MPAVTVRLSNEEMLLAKEFAAQERRTMADAMRCVFLERLEDEYDVRDLRAAKAEHAKNPITHCLEDVMKEFGINE